MDLLTRFEGKETMDGFKKITRRQEIEKDFQMPRSKYQSILQMHLRISWGALLKWQSLSFVTYEHPPNSHTASFTSYVLL